jgi:hypothetical protein
LFSTRGGRSIGAGFTFAMIRGSGLIEASSVVADMIVSFFER